MAQLFKPSINTIARGSILFAAIGAMGAFYAGSTISRGPWNTKVNIAVNQPVPFSHKHHATELGIDCRFCHSSVEKSKTSSMPPTETCMMCHSQVWTNSPLLKPVRDSYKNGTPLNFGKTGQNGWNQVNKLPEFVYFDHSIHIDRGINCSHCHGNVQDEQLTMKGEAFSMGWCLRCHRDPERFLYEDKDHPEQTPQEKVFNLYTKHQAGDELTNREAATLEGLGPTYTPSAEEREEGKKLLEKYKVKKSQLTDCWVCHR